MSTKEELDKAYKAFKKRLKIYQDDAAGNVAPAGHLSRERATIVGIQPPQDFPPGIWDELVAKGKLKKQGANLYALNKP
jgi:hypothetical protein